MEMCKNAALSPQPVFALDKRHSGEHPAIVPTLGPVERERADLLAAHPLPGVPVPVIEGLKWPLASMRRELFRKGDCLFRVGDKADRMFYIHRGAIWLPEIKKRVTAGQVIGEMGIFAPRTERTASAICDEDLEAYSMGRDEVMEFFSRDPSVAINVIQMSFKRFIENVKAETEAKERIRSELRIAHDIQVSMLPRTLPHLPQNGAIEICAALQPAKEVGGDVYDYFAVGKNKLCVLIGDASGKGVPAALFMAVGKALLKAEAMRGYSARQIITRVNKLLCAENPLCMFATALCVLLDTRTGTVECCSAGHLSPIYSRAGGKIEYLDIPRGPALGVVESAKYTSRKLSLLPGEAMFFYTDGITEAVNSQHELFSEERLKDSVSGVAGEPLAQWLDRVKGDVAAHRKDEPQSDDITMVALRFRGSSDSPAELF